MEDLGGNEAVGKRTKQLAQRPARIAEIVIRGFLDDFTGDDGVITQGQLAKIITGVRKKSVDKYTEERNLGMHNDMISTQTGLTALIRFDRVKESFNAWLEMHPEGPHTATLVENSQADGDPLYVLTLPEGAFQAFDTHVRLYPEAQIIEDQIRDPNGKEFERHDRISLSTVAEVIRIEGQGGELWQSLFFSPDGTEK
ncbi:MAG TPA: hypothetical protein VMQ52_04705 [Candidatus Saccharimonadales bacterium]|jgi:hypothetical protein|nr:hypothetical protein [Candidatus Saccharimonadales bacterium]